MDGGQNWKEEDNTQALQQTRVMRFDIDKELLALLVAELDRISSEAGREVISLTDAINDAIGNYLIGLKSHDFARLN